VSQHSPKAVRPSRTADTRPHPLSFKQKEFHFHIPDFCYLSLRETLYLYNHEIHNEHDPVGHNLSHQTNGTADHNVHASTG
jgi:hypothetical protein